MWRRGIREMDLILRDFAGRAAGGDSRPTTSTSTRPSWPRATTTSCLDHRRAPRRPAIEALVARIRAGAVRLTRPD